MRVDRRSWIERFLDALSQVLNVLLLNGDPNESISGRSYREGRWTRVWWINLLFFWQDEHCYLAYTEDLARNKMYIEREASV